MIVYVITNRANNKQYVGQTTVSLEHRMNIHKKVAKVRAYPLYHAFKKYGIEAFTMVQVDTCTNIDELNTKEQEWIAKLNTISPNGYNLTTGGRNGKHTAKTREKISKAMRGLKRSDSHKEAIRLSKTGDRHPMWGKHISETTRQKMSVASKGVSKSVVARKNMKKSALARVRNIRMSDCHPDRKHKAKGLCHQCYDHQRRSTTISKFV
jgi:group I intron endonuclease